MAVSTFWGVLVWGKLPQFSFPTLGLLPALLGKKKNTLFSKLKSSTDGGVRMFWQIQGPSRTPILKATQVLYWIFMKGWGDIYVTRKKQRPLINLLSDKEHFGVESVVCWTHLTPEWMGKATGRSCIFQPDSWGGMGRGCLSLVDLTEVQAISWVEIYLYPF